MTSLSLLESIFFEDSGASRLLKKLEELSGQRCLLGGVNDDRRINNRFMSVIGYFPGDRYPLFNQGVGGVDKAAINLPPGHIIEHLPDVFSQDQFTDQLVVYFIVVQGIPRILPGWHGSGIPDGNPLDIVAGQIAYVFHGRRLLPVDDQHEMVGYQVDPGGLKDYFLLGELVHVAGCGGNGERLFRRRRARSVSFDPP